MPSVFKGGARNGQQQNNSEGYADPTAYGALKPIMQADAALEGKVNFLIKVLKFIANEAGFDVVNRIELRDRNTGRCFK